MVLSQLIFRLFSRYPREGTSLFLNYIQNYIRVISIYNDEFKTLFNLKSISCVLKAVYSLNVTFKNDLKF